MPFDRSTSEKVQIKEEACEDSMLHPGQSSDRQPTPSPSDEVRRLSASNTKPSPRTMVHQTATNHNDANESDPDYANPCNNASDMDSADDDFSGSSEEDERHSNSQDSYIRRSTRAARKKKLFPIEQGGVSDAPASSRRVPVTHRWTWAGSSESEDSDVPLRHSRAKGRAIVEQSNKSPNTSHSTQSLQVPEQSEKTVRSTVTSKRSKMEAVSRFIVKLKLPPERLMELSCKSQSTESPYTKMMVTGPTSACEPDHDDELNHPSSQSKRKADADLQRAANKRLQLEHDEIMECSKKWLLWSRITDDSADSDEEEEDAATHLDTIEDDLPAAAVQHATTPPKVTATPSTHTNESGLKQEEVILAKVSWSKDESGSVQVRLDDCPGCHVFWERVMKVEHFFKQPSNNKGMARIANFDTKSLPDGIDQDIFKVPFTDEAYESTYHELYWDLRRLQALHPGEKIRVAVKIKWVRMKEQIGIECDGDVGR